MVIVIAIVGLVLVVPAVQFVGRLGQDVAGDGGYYVGAAAAVAALLAVTVLAARVVASL